MAHVEKKNKKPRRAATLKGLGKDYQVNYNRIQEELQMDKREILERVSKTPIIINGSGIVEMDSFGDVSVNGKSIRDTMVEVLGTGNEPYSAVNFAGSVRIEITPFPNKDLHIVEEVQND